MPVFSTHITGHTICGPFGFAVFQRTRRGNVFRGRRHSARVPLAEAIRRMAAFAECSRIWSYRLSDQQRRTWTAYANTHPITVPCRGLKWLGGQMYFMRVNVPLWLAGSPLHYWPVVGD